MTESVKFSLPTAEQEDLEESLGFLWHRRESGDLKKESVARALGESIGPRAFEALAAGGYVAEEGGAVRLTEKGEALGREVTRRHRLAERLLHDVLNVEPQAVDPNVCRLEHILSPEVTDSICRLLGHPKEDPLNRPIPAGPCCADGDSRLDPIVSSLDRLKPGDEGRIAYLRLAAHPELHKLLSLGLVPGTTVRLHQTRPAYVLQAGESQLALDQDVAKNIFVRKG
jgi:DtxR family transcriptional regulator, Mn-dependent transcriptional regulator